MTETLITPVLTLTTTSATDVSIEVSLDELIRFGIEGVCSAAQVEPPNDLGDLTVWIVIPGGGDWSNTVVGASELNAVLEWTETENA